MYTSSYVWAKIICALEQQLTEVTVSAWFDDAQVIDLTEDTLVVYSPSDLRQQIIRDRCAPYILDILRQLLQREMKLEVWGDSELREHREKKSGSTPVMFNPQFTFDSFISGASNQIAVKIAKAAANEPGQELYNPLFLYGPPGVGKTHLLYAMVNAVMQTHPEKKVVYVRADQFTNELILSIRNGKTGEFKEKYRHADVLLVDDIQFIAGKEATQEEFFHTFNDLFEHKKQIVMTADKTPENMATLEDRLKSRFGSGILIGIEPPDYPTRLEITRAKAKRYELPLKENALEYIAGTLSDNIRRIEGALKKLRAFYALSGMELTMENVRRTIEDICIDEKERPVTPELVIRNVCKYYGVEEAQLKGPQRDKGITEPRQIAMYLIRTEVGTGFADIGKLMNRDHSSVQHAVKKVEKMLALKGNPLDTVIQDIISNIKNTPS